MSLSARSAGAQLISIGWALLVIGTYLALALATTLVTGDPILATVLLGVMVAAGVCLVRWLRPSWLSYDPPAWPVDVPLRFWGQVIGCMILAFVVGQAMGLLVYTTSGSPGFEESNAQRQAAGTIAVVLVLVTAPLSEEALFRGLLFPLLRRRSGLRLSIVISTLAFALMHGNAVQVASALPLAVLMAMLYERTRMLWPLVLAHLGFNLAALLVPASWMLWLASPLPIILLGMAFGLSAHALLHYGSPGAHDMVGARGSA